MPTWDLLLDFANAVQKIGVRLNRHGEIKFSCRDPR